MTTVITISTTANGIRPSPDRRLEEKGRTPREANQQQSDPQWFIQAEHSGKADRDNRRQDEIGEQGQHHKPDVSQRGKNLRHGQCQPDGKGA